MGVLMKLGGKYLDRQKCLRTIIRHSGQQNDPWPWQDDAGYWHSSTGFVGYESHPLPCDLIEEFTDGASEPAPTIAPGEIVTPATMALARQMQADGVQFQYRRYPHGSWRNRECTFDGQGDYRRAPAPSEIEEDRDNEEQVAPVNPRFWMVLGDGRPTYEHPTEQSAHAEAVRLAGLNPGKLFVVLEAKEIVEVGVHVTVLTIPPTEPPF